MPVYALARKTMMQMGYDSLDPEDRNVLADPVKYMEDGIANEEEGIKQNKLLALKETFGEKDSKEKKEKEEKIKRAIESANVRIQKSKITLKKLEEIIAEYNDKMNRIGETPAVKAEELLDLSLDFGDVAEDIGNIDDMIEPDMKSIKTSLKELKKSCD